MNNRKVIDDVAYGVVPVAALLSAMVSGILAIAGSRWWPVPLFGTVALVSLIILYARLRRPVRGPRPWTAWRVTGTAAAALTVTATLVLAGLVASYAILGLPLDQEDLELTCASRTPHPRSAPLAADKRVTRTFMDIGGGFSHRPAFDVQPVEEDEDLPAVQQVACLRRLGSGDRLNTCHYGDQPMFGTYETTLYRGKWELDVREARTGRTIALHKLDGEDDPTCPSVTFVRGGESPPDDDTEPSVSDVLAAIGAS